MELAQSIARLMRAGDENSKIHQKLREAVDGLARHLAMILPQTSCMLPRSYYFAWWPSGEYELGKCDDTQYKNILWKLTQNQKDRETLFVLADDIATGWLDEVSAVLELEIALLTQAITKLNQFSNR